MRMLFVGFGVGVAVGAGGCYLYLSAVKQPQDRRAGLGISLVEGHHAAKFGAPETEILRQYEGYVAAYDYRTRNPKWVLEHITRASSNGDAKREGSEFFPDPGIDPRFSAKLSDFRGSGYDRGHMTPAADHKSSQKAMDETFSLINISPQVGAGFNRDYWARFERFVKELTYAAADVYIVTGPLWLPTQSPPLQQQQQDGDGGGGGGGGGEASGKAKGGRWTLVHDWIGKPPGLVAVPTHYYKVVLADPRGGGGGEYGKGATPRDPPSPLSNGTVAVGAFVMPNQPIDARNPLTAYVVPLDDLEQVAGTKFFPALLDEPRRRAALDAAAVGWRQEGLAQLKPFERISMKQAYAALPAPTDTDASSTQPPQVTSPKAPPGNASSSSSSSSSSPPPAPKTPRGADVVHICDVNACQLPRPDFYLPAGSGTKSRSSSSTSSQRQ